MSRSVWALGCVGSATIVAACQLVAGLDKPRSEPPLDGVDADVPGVDGAVPDVPDAADASAPICTRRGPPRPAVTPTSGDPRWFVLSTAQLAEGAPDLDCIDSQCTDASVPYACAARAKSKRFCDGPDGGDNQMLAARANFGISADDTVYRDRVAKGEKAILIGLLNYNGEENDSDVSFTVFPANLAKEVPNPCPPLDGGSASDVVLLNGCDTFSGDVNYLLAGVPTNVVSGYVSGRRLYVTEPHPQLVPYRSSFFEAEGLLVEATVKTQSGGPATLRGSIGGRVSPEGLLHVFGEQIDPDGGTNATPYCLRGDWDFTRKVVCEELDLPRADDAGPTEPCGAMSYFMTFEAVEAKLSNQTVVTGRPSRCDAGLVPTPPFSCP